MTEKSCGPVLTTFAVLFVILAISNFSKPLRLEPDVGFMFFGMKMHGIANAILGPAFGVLLVAYAIGILRMRRWVLPIAYAYAVYVILNLVLYSIRNAASARASAGFMIVYSVIAIGVSSGSALLLHQRREELA